MTALKHDTQKERTEVVGVAALYITIYYLLFHNKICKNEFIFFPFLNKLHSILYSVTHLIY